MINVSSTMMTENPQGFSRETFVFFLCGEEGGWRDSDMYFFFSVKQNVKDIFTDSQRRKERQK